MGKLNNNARKTGDRDFKLLLASGLLCSYERYTPEELYPKALKCYEILLDILEDARTAGDVAAVLSRPPASVQNSARSVIDLLLFNAKADPSVSLGLARDAGKNETKRRWKRLMVLYHPDRYPDDHAYEDRAKQINEAYEKLLRWEGKDSFFVTAPPVNRNELQAVDLVIRARARRRVHAFVLAFVIFACIISLWVSIII